MMNKAAMILLLLVSSSVAHADVTLSVTDTTLSRKASNVYAVPGIGEVRTVSCTVSTDGLTARVENGSKPWIYFYDQQGRKEADCQIATKPAPVLPVEHLTIRRSIATVE